tara:strand:- start:193 stop:1932 length:1740 start_codon:yes stop_codon:yes gene_type:complete
MNLKEIRDAMFAQADYSPNSSPEAITRVNGFINRAYNTLALEAPFLFFESKVQLVTEPDVKNKAGDPDNGIFDKVQLVGNQTLPAGASSDAWTWRTGYTVTQQQANPDKFTAWDFSRGWDGRMIDLIDTDGSIDRHQIRSVWHDTASDYVYFTVVRPSRDATAFEYRIFTEAYPLPDTIVQVKSVRLRDEASSFPLDIYGQQEAEELLLDGPDSQVASGIPRCLFRRQHVSLRGPSVAPVAKEQPRPTAQDGWAIPWQGPEPPGTFEYKVTYTWGKRDLSLQAPGLGQWDGTAIAFSNTSAETFPSTPPSSTSGANASRNRYREPRLESPPSPASAQAATAYSVDERSAGRTPYGAILVSLPNITYALGYMMKVIRSGVTYSRHSVDQSGVYVRIYRRRIATNWEEYGGLTNRADGLNTSQLDTDTAFYLLAEMRVDTLNEGIFYDNGTFLPDYNRRLHDINGYQTVQFYPKPDKAYQTDIRCVTRPQPLVDDADSPVLHAEAMSVLLERAMALFYENLGQSEQSLMCTQKYREALMTLSKRYGDLRPPAVPVLRRMTRATSTVRRRNSYRKWYTNSSN